MKFPRYKKRMITRRGMVEFRQDADIPLPTKIEYSKDTETLTEWFPDQFGNMSGQMFKLDRGGGIPLPDDESDEISRRKRGYRKSEQ